MDADISAGQQCKIGIGDGRAGDDGASRAVDAVVEERELAAVARLPFARQEDVGVDLSLGARLVCTENLIRID